MGQCGLLEYPEHLNLSSYGNFEQEQKVAMTKLYLSGVFDFKNSTFQITAL